MKAYMSSASLLVSASAALFVVAQIGAFALLRVLLKVFDRLPLEPRDIGLLPAPPGNNLQDLMLKTGEHASQMLHIHHAVSTTKTSTMAHPSFLTATSH